jgi:DNA-binding transcriptional MerR regulator
MANELFTRKEVAEIFKVRPHTVFFWEKKGLITPAGYVNTRPRYSIEAIEKLGNERQPLARIKAPANEK